jgi:carboxylesterase type B
MDKRVYSLSPPRLPSVAATATPKVATKSGVLLRALEDGVQVFRGVPYSEPPVGDGRFRSPVPIRWEGERDATRSGPASYQINAGNREKRSRSTATKSTKLRINRNHIRFLTNKL